MYVWQYLQESNVSLDVSALIICSSDYTDAPATDRRVQLCWTKDSYIVESLEPSQSFSHFQKSQIQIDKSISEN